MELACINFFGFLAEVKRGLQVENMFYILLLERSGRGSRCLFRTYIRLEDLLMLFPCFCQPPQKGVRHIVVIVLAYPALGLGSMIVFFGL
ncbi:hypothetical protein FQZ97_874250 [compost metagenome]